MGNCSSAQAPPAKRTKSASSPRQTLKGDDRPTRKELPALEKRKATMGLPVKAEPSPVHSQPAQTDAGSVAGTSVSPAGVVKAKADMPALSLDDHESDSPKTPQHFQNGGANGLPSYGGNFMKTSIRNGGRTPLAAAAAKGILKNVSRNGSLGGSTSGSSRSDEKGAGKWSCGKSSLESKNSSGIFTPSMCVQSPVVSLKEISGAGDELDAVFQLIDAEKYSKALPKLHALLSHRAADSADYFAIHLALSTLHGLGNDSWTAPDYRLNPSEAELAKTAEYLLGLNAKDGGSPSALLALSEMYAILKDTAHESLYMAKAAESQHPLAVLRAEIFTLVKLRKQRDAGLLAVHSYDLEKEKHVQKLIQLSEGNTRVAAHAGMLTWVSFYKGTDGVETDIYKAKELLERAIRAEMGPENGKSLKRQLQRIHKKIMTQENKSEGGLNDTLASWASVMGRSDSRFQQPDGLRTFSNSRRLPNVHRTKSEGDSVRGLKRSTSVSPSTGGLQRHNSVRSNGTETVVEVPVHGVNYYSLSSVRAAHHGLRKKRSVTDPNADTALDELDMSDGGSVKSGRSTRSGRVQKIRQRGDSITSRIRKEATSIADDVHTSRYRSLRRSHSIRSTPY